jgi:hypothetical protein
VRAEGTEGHRSGDNAIEAATPAASAATADADRATEQDLEEQCRELEVAYAGPPLDETMQLRTARWKRLRAAITRRRSTTAETQRARTELVHIDPPHLSNPEDVTDAVRDATTRATASPARPSARKGS